MKTWFSIKCLSESAAEISIYDEIGIWGVTAKDFVESLKAVGERRLTLRINSPGGSILDGLAIYNRLKEHKGGVDVIIDGVAASMASVIAMAGSTVTMPENAFMMIHNPSGVVIGESEDMRDLADLLDKMKGTLVNVYEKKSELDRKAIEEMMDAETWFTAAEALEHGFIDEVSEPLQIAAKLTEEQAKHFLHTPEGISQEGRKEGNGEGESGLTVKLNLDSTDFEAQLNALLEETAARGASVLTLEGTIAARDGEIVTLKAANEGLTNRNAQLEGTFAKLKENYENLKKSRGLSASATVLTINQGDGGGQTDPVQAVIDKYYAATPEEQIAMMRDPKTRPVLLANMDKLPTGAAAN